MGVLVWLFVLAPVVLAPVIGSFAGVLVRRLPAGMPVAMDRSRCEACGVTLSAWELVPLLGYAVLRGRCRHCRTPIAPFHPAIELAALAVPASAALASAPLASADPSSFWATCALGWTLLPLAWIDARHFWLPDVLTLPLLLAGLAATAYLDPAALYDHALAAVLAYLAFRGLALAYRRLRRRDGLGAGDAKLLAALGAWGGTASLAPTVLAAALLGLALAATMALRRGHRLSATTRLPFGTLLAAAFWVLWLMPG